MPDETVANADESIQYVKAEKDYEAGPEHTPVAPDLEEKTVDELVEIARELQIKGRSRMTHGELVSAIHEKRQVA